MLMQRMEKHIAKRKRAYKLSEAPIETAAALWNPLGRAFESSEEAYKTLHIGDPKAAQKLQSQERK